MQQDSAGRPVRSPHPADAPLLVVSREPFNAETLLAKQMGVITPNSTFYVRNHFSVPQIAASDWQLAVAGEVVRPHELTYADLLAMPSRSLVVTLECAGNGRNALHPPVPGEPWGYGAVSTAEWTGVPLQTVLERAGLTARVREILVEGADGGRVADVPAPIRYARSLDVEKALHPDSLLAYAMNGEPLPPHHGFPVRLLVPGWYGMASVKWVVRLEATATSFQGFYQADRYVLRYPDRADTAPQPLREMQVRALFITPAHDATLAAGRHYLRGLAWSGSAPVTRVEVSDDGGATWQPADLTTGEQPYAWHLWTFPWDADRPGPVTLQCRAFDALGHAQPLEPDWNELGYANNAIQSIRVTVT